MIKLNLNSTTRKGTVLKRFGLDGRLHERVRMDANKNCHCLSEHFTRLLDVLTNLIA